MSGLVLVLPELEPVFGDIRARHDPAARHGMPPHATVLYPFKAFPQLTADDHARLGAVARSFRAFELSFAEVDRFEAALWLKPEPSAPISDLTHAIVEAFPDYPPYEGQFETVIPHVTLAQGPAAMLDGLEPKLRAKLTSPLHARVEAVSLFRTVRRRWTQSQRYLLG